METKKKKEKITKAGQKCWHCGTAVVKAIPRKKPRKNRAYYFEFYFNCPNKKCDTIYMVESAKRFWTEK